MRTILIDDEAAARGYLRELLTAHPAVDIIAEAKDGLEAIESVNRLAPELVFLDVQMPVLDGFQILPYLKHKPMVVFSTAYDRYALQAFEVNAVDYLLKPVQPDRLAKSLDRVRNEWDKLSRLSETKIGEEGPRSIVCHKNNTYRILWLREILMFSKDGRYTMVHIEENERFFTDLTLDRIARDLSDLNFFRVNRGVIVRRDLIRSFTPKAFGVGDIETLFGESIQVSRGRLRTFREWFFNI